LLTFSHIDGATGVETGLPVPDTNDADTSQRKIATTDRQKELIKRVPEASVDRADHRFAVDADMHFTGSSPCPDQAHRFFRIEAKVGFNFIDNGSATPTINAQKAQFGAVLCLASGSGETCRGK
jgi:hypothetical protein